LRFSFCSSFSSVLFSEPTGVLLPYNKGAGVLVWVILFKPT
jgi:hypothetical protein